MRFDSPARVVRTSSSLVEESLACKQNDEAKCNGIREPRILATSCEMARLPDATVIRLCIARADPIACNSHARPVGATTCICAYGRNGGGRLRRTRPVCEIG